MEAVDSQVELALWMARRARKILEAKFTKEQFIKDTTSTFLMSSWRKGSEADRNLVEGQLEAFKLEKDVVKRIDLLNTLAMDCMRLSNSTDSDKFKTAVEGVRSDCYDLIECLKEEPAWLEHLAEQERQQQEVRRLAEEKEAQRIEAALLLDHSGRVGAFKEKYGTSGTLDKLLDGIEEGGMAKLAANFKTIGFTYSMTSVKYTALIGGRTDGDCSTVSNTMAYIAREILGVKATVNSCDDMLADTTTKTIDGAKEPNGLDGAFWVFQNHFWVESPSGNFDPLFGGALDKSSWKLLQEAKDIKSLNTTVENYGGKFKIIFLLGDDGMSRMLAGDVTETIWDKHCEKAKVEGIDFAGFKEELGI